MTLVVVTCEEQRETHKTDMDSTDRSNAPDSMHPYYMYKGVGTSTRWDWLTLTLSHT